MLTRRTADESLELKGRKLIDADVTLVEEYLY